MAQLLDGPDVQAIALAQIPREEFRLRGAAGFSGQFGTEVAGDGSPAALYFWDEVDWDAVDKSESRSLVLTDHNKMTDQVAAHFADRVKMVLDHHAGVSSYPEAVTVVDESLGSACTLVVEEYLRRPEKLSLEIGTLLAGVIRLDCRNFDPKEKKGTSRDSAALEELARLDLVPSVEPNAWYRSLMEARKDVSHLSVRELMLLDTKVVTLRGMKVAVASFFGTLTDVCSKAGKSDEIVAIAQALARNRGYEAVILLFSKDKALAQKRALAFVPSSDAAADLCATIVSQMRETPGNLPDDLKENPLYQTQGLVEVGFELEPLKEFQPLDVYSIRGETSRKTVLPFAMAVAG
ncbi:unnamed protein product [Effrenium voratum]|uniref:inorganic diphosphatase n=1 Tax=Effrenium voratum TaxID=2562239 RepID=A0AA36I3Y5_9DINO|nr:unnamed protein product [Effrenium voratum]